MRYLLLLVLVTACSHRAIQSVMTLGSTAKPHAISFLSLGDSYTIGESVPENDRWSVQLAGLLRDGNLDVADPDIIAKTGWTTGQLRTAIAQSGNKKTYNLVSLLIGVNNQYRGRSLARYRTDFRKLLQTAVAFADGKPGRVMVLSIPDWGQSPFAKKKDKEPAKIGSEIDAFNAIAQDECKKASVAFVNITPLTRSAVGDPSQFADDGLHYSSKQMKRWAEAALPVAKDLLAK
ncbi:MAG: SGNH/GDSL hydrolase family protein [Bacteroidetes bacterium]|nr:SGNH/GDSL hydrolase family protein [Fibrella sp.]